MQRHKKSYVFHYIYCQEHCIFKVSRPKCSYIWLHSVSTRPEVNDPPKTLAENSVKCSAFCALQINASTSFPFIIYSLAPNVFFSLYPCRGFFLPFGGRYSNPGVKDFFKRAKGKTLLYFCPYPSYGNKKQFRFYVFHLRQEAFPFLSWLICIKFYGDEWCKNALTSDPLPVSVIKGSSSYFFKSPQYHQL